MPKSLYIKLEQNRLAIGILRQKDNNFYLQNEKEIISKDNIIYENKIFNPSLIYLKIKRFLNKNKIKNTNAIIFCPTIMNLKKEEQDLLILQISLCISKTGILIKKIYGRKIYKKEDNMWVVTKEKIDNELDFFKQLKPNKKDSTAFWLSSTSLMLILIVSIQYKLHSLEQKKQDILRQKIDIARKEFNAISKKAKLICNLQNQKKRLIAQKKRIEKKIKNQNNPSNLLSSISTCIPNHCWITNLKATNSKNHKSVLILGHALFDKDILSFVSNLSKDKNLRNVKIELIKKESALNNIMIKSKISKIYRFKISAIRA